jgi:hypothetical protein
VTQVPVKGAPAVVHLIPRRGGKRAGQAPMAVEVGPCFLIHWSHGVQLDGDKVSQRACVSPCCE